MPQTLEHLAYALAHLGFWPAKLQRAERHFVEYRRVEQLHFQILEHQAHLPPEGKCKFVVGEALFLQLFAAEPDRALLPEIQAIENPQQRGFSRTVGAKQSPRGCPPQSRDSSSRAPSAGHSGR